MNDMNGHESTNGQSYPAANGFHVYPVNDPMTIGLTKQQLAILRHLQTGESITPYKAKSQYRCKALAAVVSVLRGRGWDIKTYRCKDRMGEAFSSYRLPIIGTRGDLEEDSVPFFEDAPQAPDPTPDLLSIEAEPAELIPEPPVKKEGKRGRQANGARNIDVIKERLMAGKTISPQEALDLYGMTEGSLTGVISRLRNAEKWQIDTIPILGSKCGYRLSEAHGDTETRNQVEDNEHAEVSGESATACRSAVGSTPTSNISFRFGKDGPELRLIGEGEPDDRPFCKIDPEHVQLLGMFVQMAGGK